MNYSFLPIVSVIIVSVIILFSAVILTKTSIKLMGRLNIVDRPGKRRVHIKVTPRGGGIGLVLSLIIFLPLCEYYILPSSEHNAGKILLIFLPIAVVSFQDDISNLSVWIRLLIHLICSAAAVLWLIHPQQLLPDYISHNIDLVFTTIALLAFLNIYNFLDGIDGITAAQSIHLSCTILILCLLKKAIIPGADTIIIIAVIILSWSGGFIFFNWQPAKIFLGDVGSISLGFLFGVCLIKIATTSMNLLIACIIATLYYIADGGLTIFIRLIRGERIWQPHLDHFFQKAVQKGKTHAQVVIKIAKCNFLLMLLSVASLYYPFISLTIAVIFVLLTMFRLVT